MTKKGVTLIEILIWVIIFSVWILTILVVMAKNITVMDRLKNQTISTFLAKEWIEIVYNLRDSNLDKWLEWNCIQYNSQWACLEKFLVWNTYKVQQTISWYNSMTISDTDFESNKLYYHEWRILNPNNWAPIPLWNWFTGFWYSHELSDNPTFFSRNIKFNTVLSSCDWCDDTDKLMKIESDVEYIKWSYTGWIIMESFIWNR